MQLDLLDLRLLANVAEENSLTRGAERSHLSLPAASIRIKNLEARLGVDLLYRTRQGVTLTPVGESVLHHARVILRQLEMLRGDLQGHIRGLQGTVRIYATTTAITELLPVPLSRFLAAHPDVNITMQEHRTATIVRAVVDGIVDVGVVAEHIPNENLELFPFAEDRLVLVVPELHPLTARDSVLFAETVEFDYVGLTESSALHSFITEASRLLARPPRFRIDVGNVEAACRMVALGVGIAMIPASAAARFSETAGIRIVNLDDPWANRNLQVCVRRLDELPVYARELVATLIAHRQFNRR